MPISPTDLQNNPFLTGVQSTSLTSGASTSNSSSSTSAASSSSEDSLVDTSFEDSDAINVGISSEDEWEIELQKQEIELAEAEMQEAFNELMLAQQQLESLNSQSISLANSMTQNMEVSEKQKIQSQLLELAMEKSTIYSTIDNAMAAYSVAETKRTAAIDNYNLAVDTANANMEERYNALVAQQSKENEEYVTYLESLLGNINVGSSSATSNYSNGGDVANSLLATAAAEIGVKETRDNDSDRIAQYRGYAAANPWCASFASWCMQQTFGDKNPLKFTESVSTIREQAIVAGMYGTKANYTPKQGDLIIFKGGSMSHVGIVEKVENGKVHIIDGNSSNQVKRNVYDLNNGNIHGYVKTEEWVKSK